MPELHARVGHAKRASRDARSGLHTVQAFAVAGEEARRASAVVGAIMELNLSVTCCWVRKNPGSQFPS